MKITCESCGAKYTIADKKVQGRRVKIRCKSCSKQIVVDAKPEDSEEAGIAVQTDESSLGDDQAALDPHAVATTWEVNLSDTDQRSMTEAEILAGWESGVVTQNAFVWKDGLADWMPIGQIPELVPGKAAAPVEAPKPASPSLPPAPPARTFADKPKVHKAAAKLPGTGARPDLFGRAATAGSEEEAQNQLLAGATPYVEQNPTGARNENSVLFSIDALKAGFSKTPSRSEPAPRAHEDDPFGMSLASGGVMGGLSLGGNDALLSQPAPEPPKPMLVAAAALPPGGAGVAPKDDKRKLVAILGAAVAVLLVIIVVMAVGGDKDDTKLAQADVSAKPDSEKSPASADGKAAEADNAPPKAADTNAEATKNNDAAGKDGAAADPKGTDTKVATTTKPATGATPGGAKPPTGKPDDPVKVKDNPSSGVGTFNKSAAKTSLSSAANSAAGCKRPDGPVGSGQVVVTFAPSGRVTSANVGSPFGGTRVGSCVASIFRRASVPSFSGSNVTVSKNFTISR